MCVHTNDKMWYTYKYSVYNYTNIIQCCVYMYCYYNYMYMHVYDRTTISVENAVRQAKEFIGGIIPTSVAKTCVYICMYMYMYVVIYSIQ